MKKLFAVVLLLSGCVAADPNKIAPMSISPVGYTSLDCQALAAEDQRVAGELGPLMRKQDDRRGKDSVGILLIGISPTGIGSPEFSAQISRLKGERETIAQAKASKGCSEPQAEVVTKWKITPEELAARKAKIAAQN